MIDLYQFSLLSILLAGTAIILAITEVGWRLGRRVSRKGGDHTPSLEGPMLGLLALMVGFTFAMALSRFEARRDAVLNEANAIGTTALRARLLPEPHRAEVLKLLREYVKIRLDVTQRSSSRIEVVAAIDRSNAIQENLWQHAKAVAAKDNSMVPSGLFIQTLNEMIDSQAKRLAALRNRVPNIVVVALFGIAAVAGGFAGYSTGFDKRRSRIPVMVMGVVIAGVIILILDVDRPADGFIDVSQQPMLDTAASLEAFTD